MENNKHTIKVTNPRSKAHDLLRILREHKDKQLKKLNEGETTFNIQVG